MLETVKLKVVGHLTIKDRDTGEVLIDQHNDILYGNLAAALAHSLIGNRNSFLFYMAFGNGGAYIGPTGLIQYKSTLGGANSLVKNPTANLYNTIYVKKMSNDSTATSAITPLSKAYVPGENDATNYEDVLAEVVLDYNEPSVGITSSTINQLSVDNSNFVGTNASVSPPTVFDPSTLVFNEIGLFAGSDNLFTGSSTATVADVNNFVTATPNYNLTAGTKSKIMLTHVVFHPQQKAANRALEIFYTLRIVMGTEA